MQTHMSQALSCVALIAITCACSDPSTQDTLSKIQTANQITIGVKTDYRPFGFIDSDGNNAGLEIDIARQMAKAIVGSEDNVAFVPVVAANRIEFLKQGKIDLIIATMTDTEERRQEIAFSESYYSDGAGLLTQQGNGVESWDDLKGKKVCGIQGAFYNKALTEMGLDLMNFPGTAEAYKGLKDGRCIGFVFDNSALAGKLQEPQWSQGWHIPLPVILSKPWGMGMRQEDVALKEKVDAAIVKMEAAGFIVQGEAKWQIPATDYARERMERAQQRINPDG